MAKMTYAKGVTSVGKAMWSHLLSTEQFDGKDTNKYTVSLSLAPKDEKALLAKINKEWEKFKESDDMHGKKCTGVMSNGFKEGEEGRDNLFKFKQTAVIHTRTGKTFEHHVPVYDAKCQEISGTMEELGNGSKVKVAYELVPFYVNARVYGVSLRLSAVQVLEFQSQETTAKDFGFGEEEGYQSEAQEEEEIPVPFDVEEDGSEF